MPDIIKVNKKIPTNFLARIILLLTIILLIPLFTFAQIQQKELLIGLVPEMNVIAQSERFKPLMEYLTKKTGIKFRTKMLRQYGDTVDNFNDLQLDGAFFGSFTAVLALNKLNVEPIVRPVNLDGTSTYHGHIFVRKDSGIKSVKDMKGKTIAFVDKATTAGYLFPLAYFRFNGIVDIGNYFEEYYFTGSHDAAINAVLNNKADIGAAKNTVYDKLRKENPKIDEELLILVESEKVPSNGLFIKKTLSDNFMNKLKKILLNIDKDPEGKIVLEKLGAIKFIDTSDADYIGVINIIRKAGIDINRYDYYSK